MTRFNSNSSRSSTHFVGVASLLATVAILFAGCGPLKVDPPEPPKTSVGKLRLLVVGDPRLAAAIEREWTARGRAEIEIVQRSVDDTAQETTLDADVVIFPSGMLGELVEAERILPLPESLLTDDALVFDEIFSLLRRQEIRWGRNQTYALPLGSPQLVLMYRPDVFRRLNLTPPTNWQEYQTTAEVLNTNGFRLAEPLAPGWAGQMLLARATAYAKHRSQFSVYFDYASSEMTPLIDREPFVRALTELSAVARLPAHETAEMTPKAAAQAMLNGKLAMAVTWPCASILPPHQDRDAEKTEVAFAELPGSTDVYNFFNDRWEVRPEATPTRVPLLGTTGRLAAVARETNRRAAAFETVGWLTGPEVSVRVSPFSDDTAAFRDSHVARANAWLPKATGYDLSSEYGKLLRTAFGRATAVCSPRIPGRERYLAALDVAVRQVVVEGDTPRKALRQAAAKWRELNEELGVEKQRAAYRRSVGADR
jgi:ABC-type glycerol-3-phosphate transport system substrate-binding protein